MQNYFPVQFFTQHVNINVSLYINVNKNVKLFYFKNNITLLTVIKGVTTSIIFSVIKLKIKEQIMFAAS